MTTWGRKVAENNLKCISHLSLHSVNTLSEKYDSWETNLLADICKIIYVSLSYN